MNIPTRPEDSGPVVNLIHWTISRLRHLEPGDRYCLHEVLAITSWNAEDPLYNEQARRFSWLIVVNRLPFVIAGVRGRDQNLYRYTPWRLVEGKCVPFQATEQEH